MLIKRVKNVSAVVLVIFKLEIWTNYVDISVIEEILRPIGVRYLTHVGGEN